MNARRIIDDLLELDEQTLVEYADDPKPLLTEMGVVFSEKAAEVFDAVYGDEFPHVVVEGPRGGGKTFIITLALGCRFVLKHDDIFHLGGSEEQAKNGFRYITEFITGSEAFEDFVADDLKTAATTKLGNWYKIAACSGKRVRGPHAGDPHAAMDYQPHGGCCYTDEEAEIPDEIVDAMKYVTNTARPRKRVRSSTKHKSKGRFKEVTANPKKFGAHLIKYDIIDVVEGCDHPCQRCPMGHYFAGPLFGVQGSGSRVQGKSEKRNSIPIPIAIPIPTKKSIADWEAWKAENGFPIHERGMCEGRAKMHSPGHFEIESVFQDVTDSQCRESLEIELFGRDRATGSLVFDSAKLELAIRPGRGFTPGYPVYLGVDWGWNWSVIIAAQAFQNEVEFLEVIFSRHELMSELETTFFRLRDEYNAWEVSADASHKRENETVREWGFEVVEVPFAQLKDYGVRWLKGVAERGQLILPGKIVSPTDAVGAEGKYVFDTPGHKKFFKQALEWHEKDGKIVKLNDHGPDAALTLAVYLEVQQCMIESAGSGRRASMGMDIDGRDERFRMRRGVRA